MAPRKKRPPLSRRTVLEGAMRLADSEGLEAVTMRRLASTLGVEAMSLYHHLSGKEGLLDGLVEALVTEVRAEVGTVEPAGDWRVDLRSRCLAARRVMLRHPWGPALVGSRSSIPPSTYPYYEDVLATMIEGGLSYQLAHKALHALGSMVLGFVQELFTPASGGESAEDAGAGAGGEEEAQLAEMAATLPHLTAMVASEMHATGDPTLGWCDSQAEFEFTLDLLLDGLDRQRTPGRPAAAQGAGNEKGP